MTDTGAPYPNPDPVPGSNAIGSFVVGVSPIGDIPQFNIWTTVIARYANSPIITGIITAFNAAMDLTELLDEFFDNQLNVLTAIGYGLDVWGRIVDVSRTLQLPGTGTYFGFAQQSPTVDNFAPGGQSPFYSGQQPVTLNYNLTDTQYRRLILAKAAANICDGSIPAINQILLNLFPSRGTCYVRDNQNMSLTYVFGFVLTQVESAIITQSGVLPTPAGVVATVEQLVP